MSKAREPINNYSDMKQNIIPDDTHTHPGVVTLNVWWEHDPPDSPSDRELDTEIALLEIKRRLFPGQTVTNAQIIERVRELQAYWSAMHERRE